MVTYTTPIIRPDETGFHVVSIHFDYEAARVQIAVHHDPDGDTDVIRIGSQSDVDAGRAHFTLSQFNTIVNDGPIATLNQRVEQALIDAGRYPAGTVA